MPKDNEGAIFANDKRRPDKQDPTHTGSLMVGGVEYYINAWKNEAKDGKKAYFALKLKPKTATAQKSDW